MINTGLSSYVQNGGLQSANIVQSQSSQSPETPKVEEEQNSDEISLSLSSDSKAMLKIDNLQEQIDKIFGVKKDLNPDELEKEKELKAEIKKLNQNLELPYSSSDKESIRNLDRQMKELLQKDFHSFDDDAKVFDFTKQINSIINQYDKPSLKEDDANKLTDLVKELRTLQGYKNPEVPELIDAQKLYTQMDMVKTELKISKLDKNSASYASENSELQKELSASKEKLVELDNDKIEYKEEESRETSKHAIKTSLESIEKIKNNFFGGSQTMFTNEQSYGLSQNSTSATSENKWLNFLQSTREELYTGAKDEDVSTNEDNDLLNIIDRVKNLHN